MYLYIGQDTVINSNNIIGIFDLDNTSVSIRTRDFLKKAQQSDKIEVVSPEIPKSFVLCDKKVYLSPVMTTTLKKRARIHEV